jgi:hypothetical protein
VIRSFEHPADERYDRMSMRPVNWSLAVLLSWL